MKPAVLLFLLLCLLGGGGAIAAPAAAPPAGPGLSLPYLELPPPLPEGIRAMVDTAIASRDPQTVATVVAIAKRAAPAHVEEIDAMAAGYQQAVARAEAEKKEAERRRLATASMLALWSGQVEVGGSWSTGNTRAAGLYGNVALKRTGLDWEHELTARVDYQQTNGVTTTERTLAAYQPRYKFDPQHYAYGLEQYEHDRFLGYRHRLTSAIGVGVVAVDNSDLRLEFDIGPAFRYTQFYIEPDESRLAARGSLSLKWLPFDTVTIKQDAALYLQKGGTTASSTTSLDTLLFGPLKARLSYNVQYESNTPAWQKNTDTVSRASLVYSF